VAAARKWSGGLSKGALRTTPSIGEVLPQQPKAWSEIRLRQLLNHSSGLPEYAKNPRFGIGNAPPPEKLLTYIKDKDLRFDPGSRYEYSNSDNIVVALMVQSTTNRT
jgi:D-alanyl-D-alanine carboxypeptidase